MNDYSHITKVLLTEILSVKEAYILTKNNVYIVITEYQSLLFTFVSSYFSYQLSDLRNA
jgi:hypothetical protein